MKFRKLCVVKESIFSSVYDGVTLEDDKGYQIEIPKRQMEILTFLTSKSNCYVSGGVFKDIINQKSPRDYDLYFDSDTDYRVTLNSFIKNGDEALYENQNCIAFRVKLPNNDLEMMESFVVVELIKPKKEHNTIEKNLNHFDFSICKFYYRWGCIYAAEGALEDLQDKKIVIKNWTNPLGTINRVVKYTNYGFKLSNFQFLKLWFHLSIYMFKHRNEENLVKYLLKQLKIKYNY